MLELPRRRPSWSAAGLKAACCPAIEIARTSRRLRGRRADLRAALRQPRTPTASTALPAPTAADALRLCHYKAPDLLLLDLGLPDASGLDVLREIRTADGRPRRFDPELPVIVAQRAGAGRRARPRARRGRRRLPGQALSLPRAAGPAPRGATGGAASAARARAGRGARVDASRREVRVAGETMKLANKEFELLRALALGAPSASSPRRSCCATSGASGPWARDPNPRLARQPAAPQARPGRRPVRRQLLGRRLPADRRVRDAVGATAALRVGRGCRRARRRTPG